jgi:hypothetical protein
MAHNTLLRADLAAWNVALPVTPGEFWGLDENVFKSINGDDGGTWTPAAAIVIGGSGVDLTSATNRLAAGAVLELEGTVESDQAYAPARIQIVGSTGDINVNNGGDLNIETGGEVYVKSGGVAWVNSGSTIHADGAVGFGSTAAVTFENGSATNFNGGSALAVLSGCTFTLPGTMAVTGAGSITAANGTSILGANGSTIQFAAGSTSNFYGSTTLSGTVALGAATTVTTAASTDITIDGTLSTGTTGHIAERISVGADAAGTYYGNASTARTIVVRGLSANRAYNLSASNIDGARLTFVCGGADTGFYADFSGGAVVVVPDGTSITNFRVRNTAGFAFSVTFVWEALSGVWIVENALMV